MSNAQEFNKERKLQQTADVKWPAEGGGKRDASSRQPLKTSVLDRLGPVNRKAGDAPNRDGDRSLPRGIIWGVLALVAIFVFSFAAFLYGLSGKIFGSVARDLEQVRSGIADLKNLEPKLAEEKFSAASEDISLTFGGVLKKIRPLFEGAGDFFVGFQNLAGQGVILAQEADFLENNLLTFLLNQNGDELIRHLKVIQKTLRDINSQSDKLSSGAARLKTISPAVVDFYLPLKLDIGRYQKFVDALIVWLEADSPRHLLVMLQNPSEIRPAGGFLGSYADIAIKNASVMSIDVHDVNDADRELRLKVVPPQPLQALVTRWRAADANWFFNFPDSAGQVIKFLEASDLYAKESVKFDGAVAVSPKVIGDILALTGPVRLKNGITLDQENFLIEIQKNVQLSQAQMATYPKGVLEELSSALFGKLGSLDRAVNKELLGFIRDWLAKKDLIAYFKDGNLEEFFDDYVASGRVYDLPTDFMGDYLAIVDANIGGGKSDLFIKQDVLLESQINIDGIVSNRLVITREHLGGKSPYWWYKVPNQNYVRIFTFPNSQLTNFQGGFEKKIAAPVNYQKGSYSVEPIVQKVESGTERMFNYPAVSSYIESGKKVFSAWSKVRVGEKTQIAVAYSHRLYLPPTSSTIYQFVFEKQAGSERHYKFEIGAPVGFRFKENNLPVYEYESDDPPGRLILNLTLSKILQ